MQKTKIKSSKFRLKMLPIIFSVVWLWAGSAAVAQACGGFLSNPDSNVKPDKLTAAIIHDGQRETLILKLDYNVNQGSVQDFGWVMPLPANPQVVAAPEDIFTRLTTATKPKQNYLEKAVAVLDELTTVWRTVWKGSQIGGAYTQTGAPAAGGTRVISQTNVGAFDVTVLSASDQNGLKSWADKNGYSIRSLSSAAVQDYIAQKWVFVLAKLNPDQQTNIVAGQSQPIALTFDSAEPIYPWSLAAYNINGELAANRTLSANIYLLKSETRLAFLSAPTGLLAQYAENLSEPASQNLLKGINGATSSRYFLTHYAGRVTSASVAAQDLKFSRDSDQNELNSGNLSGLEWMWASLITFFYLPLTLLFLFNITIPVVILVVAVIYFAARKNRGRYFALMLITAFVLAALLIVFVAIGKNIPLMLISIVPSGLLVLLLVPRLWTKKAETATVHSPARLIQ